MTTPDLHGPSIPAIPIVGDGSGIEAGRQLHEEELHLALRNKAMPLEALRYDVTPTGMHYTLIHYDIPSVDTASWRLDLHGEVGKTLSFSLDELKERPVRTLRVTLECAGDGRALLRPRPISQPWLTGAIGTAEWTGTPLRLLLEEAGIAGSDTVREILFTGMDRGIEGGVEQVYQRSLPLQTALHDDVLLAWAMNGAPIEPQHGYPVRLVVPGWYGMAHVKWLRSVEAISYNFEGYQQAVAYRYSQSRNEAGEPVTLMRVRSLMIPPGIPDFLTRTRLVPRGTVTLLGRAWSGAGCITGVDVSVDGGATWAPAEVGEPTHDHSWQLWSYVWDASSPGPSEICCRARDNEGNIQPVEQYWTARGMGNNSVQRIGVVVV
ncbi:MAG: sulfite oxidase [Chloroflexota bacterium]|nr:sulfite oxidase [Chloroflexota bacterium]